MARDLQRRLRQRWHRTRRLSDARADGRCQARRASESSAAVPPAMVLRSRRAIQSGPRRRTVRVQRGRPPGGSASSSTQGRTHRVLIQARRIEAECEPGPLGVVRDRELVAGERQDEGRCRGGETFGEGVVPTVMDHRIDPPQQPPLRDDVRDVHVRPRQIRQRCRAVTRRDHHRAIRDVGTYCPDEQGQHIRASREKGAESDQHQLPVGRPEPTYHPFPLRSGTRLLGGGAVPSVEEAGVARQALRQPRKPRVVEHHRMP